RLIHAPPVVREHAVFADLRPGIRTVTASPRDPLFRYRIVGVVPPFAVRRSCPSLARDPDVRGQGGEFLATGLWIARLVLTRFPFLRKEGRVPDALAMVCRFRGD